MSSWKIKQNLKHFAHVLLCWIFHLKVFHFILHSACWIQWFCSAFIYLGWIWLAQNGTGRKQKVLKDKQWRRRPVLLLNTGLMVLHWWIIENGDVCLVESYPKSDWQLIPTRSILLLKTGALAKHFLDNFTDNDLYNNLSQFCERNTQPRNLMDTFLLTRHVTDVEHCFCRLQYECASTLNTENEHKKQGTL